MLNNLTSVFKLEPWPSIKYLCSFLSCLKGVNAAYDILMVCNLNIYELAHRLLSRRKSADVSV